MAAKKKAAPVAKKAPAAEKTAAKNARGAKAAAKNAPAKKASAEKAPAAEKAAAKKTPAAEKAAAPKKAAAKKSAAPAPGPAPKVGSKAPDFTLVDQDGKEVRLKDFRGKNVVLYFYPRDMTPGCTVQACGFRDAQSELAEANAVVLGVSRDTPATHTKFRAKEKLNFPLLSDPNAETIAGYGSWGEKSFMGRKSIGILRTTVLIDGEGKVRKVFPKVATKTHAKDVLDALAELRS